MLLTSALAITITAPPVPSDAPIGKRIQWFTSTDTGTPATLAFLLKVNRDIVDGVYPCCGVGSFSSDGSLVLPELNYERDIKPYREAGMRYMPTFGGSSLPLAAWEQREAIADQILAWTLKYNLTGVHNDWESHGDAGVGAYKFYDMWRAVAGRLRTHGLAVGTCVETAPANVSHPWAPRTPNNDTTWHSYMFNWDYPLALDYMGVVTNMATYPMMHTTDGDNSWCSDFPTSTWCSHGCEDFVDHLTPAYKFLEKVECNPSRHTVSQWCGLKGHIQDMIDAGTDAASGQLSPGIWMVPSSA